MLTSLSHREFQYSNAIFKFLGVINKEQFKLIFYDKKLTLIFIEVSLGLKNYKY